MRTDECAPFALWLLLLRFLLWRCFGGFRCGYVAAGHFGHGELRQHVFSIRGRRFRHGLLLGFSLLCLWLAAAFFRLSLRFSAFRGVFSSGLRRGVLLPLWLATALFGLVCCRGFRLCCFRRFFRLLCLWFATPFFRLAFSLVGGGRTAAAALLLLVGGGCGKIHGLLVEYAVNEFFFFGGIGLFQAHLLGDGFKLLIGHFFQFRDIVHMVAGGYSSVGVPCGIVSMQSGTQIFSGHSGSGEMSDGKYSKG